MDEEKQAPRNLFQRLHAVMGDVKYIQKQRGGAGMPYPAVLHDDVTAKVRPALLEHGVYYFATVDSYKTEPFVVMSKGKEKPTLRTEVTLRVVFVNIDDPEDRLEVTAIGFGVDPGDKSPGMAVSYAVKYALLKALGLETGIDPDMYQEEVEIVGKAEAESNGSAPRISDEKRLLKQKCLVAAIAITNNPDGHVGAWMRNHGIRSLYEASMDDLTECLADMKAEAVKAVSDAKGPISASPSMGGEWAALEESAPPQDEGDETEYI